MNPKIKNIRAGRYRSRLWLGAAVTAGALMAGWTQSQEAAAPEGSGRASVTFSAALTAAQASGSGTASISIDPDARRLDWEIEYAGLETPVSGIHLHRAQATEEAVFSALTICFPAAASPVQGSIALSDAQLADLLSEEWLIGVSAHACPPGELSGTLAVAQAEPAVDSDDAIEAADAAASVEDQMILGEAYYAYYCSECHGSNGYGDDEAEPLAANATLRNVRFVVEQIVNGFLDMPAFPELSVGEITAIVNYIRNAFGNSFGLVAEEEVEEFR